MKKKLKALILGIFLLIPLATSVWALPVTVGDSIHVHDGVGNVTGGQFDIYDSTNSKFLFSSFCLELHESLDFSTAFIVNNISDRALLGGVHSNPGVGDPLSLETKWLYWNFISGELDNKTGNIFTYNDVQSANGLQVLIWKQEEEIVDYNSYNPTARGIADALNTAFLNRDLNEKIGAVAVMNLTYPDGTLAQSLLTPVPEPGTILLLSAGLFGLAVYSRRRMQN